MREHTKLLNGPRLFYMFYIANIKPIYRCVVRVARRRVLPFDDDAAAAAADDDDVD